MAALYIFVSIVVLIISILMMIRFFQIASNVKQVKAIMLSDYQNKLLNTPQNMELQKIVDSILERPATKFMDTMPDWIQFKFDGYEPVTAQKEFDLWVCEFENSKFYFVKQDDAIKALYHLQTQK